MPVPRLPACARAFFAALAAAVWLSAGPFPAAGAQAAPPRRTLTAVPAGGPIKVDGVLSEDCWKTPGESGFTQSEPLDGKPPSERTTVWIAFDRESVYVAARMEDASPAGVTARLGRRDEPVESDWFIIGFDPYRDRRSGFFFAVNPAGSIMDGTLFNDEGKDLTWDGVWASAARIDGTGWTAEMRIPFHQLRFRDEAEPVWGVDAQRSIRRKNETDFLVWIPKEESGFVSRFADLTGLRGIRPGRAAEILPYAAGKAERSPAVPGDPFHTGRQASANAGLDLKAALRSDLTLDLSLNPDFGQVEVDPAVINISDQETYYQEKRPFFIEGASIFDFGKGGPNAAASYGWTDPAFFYSRRIGRAPQGSVASSGFSDRPDWTTILGAAKVTGKIGRGFSLGAVAVLGEREYARLADGDARAEAEVEPFTAYGVVRGLKESDDGRSGLGFIATSVVRDLRDPALAARLAGRAFSLGADGWTFLDRERTWALSGWAGATRVEGTPEAMTRLQTSSLHYFQRPDADYVSVDPEATSLGGWAGRLYLNKQKGQLVFNAALGAMSPGFEANDLGYHTRGDLINGHVQAGWRVFHPGPLLRTWSAALTYTRGYDFGGNRVGEYWYADGEAQLLSYWTVGLHLDYEPPKYSHYLTRGGPMAYYPSGSTVQVSLASDARRSLIGKLKASYRYHPSGGFNYQLSLGLTWKPSPNFSLSVAPGWTYRYAEGQWIMKVDDPLKTSTMGVRYVLSDIVQKILPVEIRLSWTFTPRLSLQGYLQPYLGAGDYSLFKELRAARTFDFDAYGTGGSTLDYAGGVYTADPDGPDGPAAPFSFADPDFSLKSLRGTFVLRWEYRPGSMLYLVWTQVRQDDAHPGELVLGRDVEDLLRAPGANVFLLKISYRFEL